MVAVGFIPRSSIQSDWCRVSDTGARDSTHNRLAPPQELPPSLRDKFAHPPGPWAEASELYTQISMLGTTGGVNEWSPNVPGPEGRQILAGGGARHERNPREATPMFSAPAGA